MEVTKDQFERPEHLDVKPDPAANVPHQHSELYLEALRLYPNDESIDAEAEKRLVRKIDFRILPLLGICYFFYVSSLPAYPIVFQADGCSSYAVC